MHPLISNILLTGHPGCGKTTLVRRVVDGLSVPARGFYTEEVRGATGRRTGFDVVMTDGRRGSLARVDSTGPRVGRYGVRLDFLENIALPYLAEHKDTVIIIDEVGKMECFSDLFKTTVRSFLDSSAPVIGTVALGGSPFIREVRSRSDVELIDVNPMNREELVEELIKRLSGNS
jgi:nucleoside-triphosphatase